ncbi:hypothetical protein F5Y16DRAFT_387603 [Xylariaceae sp. FL0255]|nr:hypothetical protein F5Y16DRAFT_387603 [Xylariaceae sp. FL0255]
MAAPTGSRARLCLTNIESGEIVYQRCLLITGTCHDFEDPEDFVAIRVKDGFNQSSSQQNWPAASGAFRCLLMLHAGPNKVEFDLYHKGQVCSSSSVVIQYQPLLQLPPLHLAILVASDSPLLIDCPPAKRGAISSAHSTLDAAIVKLRMAAYMWQAVTAEDFRLRGMGRRTFRLDEEWGLDTTTAASLHTDSTQDYMDNVAKIHIVRTEKTVAELRDPSLATFRRHQNALIDIFSKALMAHGSPFLTSNRPVVAGMVLDSHYSVEKGIVLGHGSQRLRDPTMSLGVFGSHTTYSWPRFLEEIPSCLLDRTQIGDAVANDHGQCSTMGDACCVGQGSMYYQVRRAMETEGMDRPPFPWSTEAIASWTNAFVARPSAKTSLLWDLQIALIMMRKNHFKLPGDSKKLTTTEEDSQTTIECALDENDEAVLKVVCMAGIARIRFNGESTKEIDFLTRGPNDPQISLVSCPAMYMFTCEALEEKVGRGSNAQIEVLGMHGKVHRAANIWEILADRPFIKVPGTSLVLQKRSVKPAIDGSVNMRNWTVLLRRRSTSHPSRMTIATRIELCVGAIWDGARVFYTDGTHVNCGKAEQGHYGGHQTEDKSISEDEVFQISEVAVNIGNSSNNRELWGCRMTLADDAEWGALNNGHSCIIKRLAPRSDERIIGFYGKSSESNGFCTEFGIITAPRDIVDSEDGLPPQLFSMPELMNQARENNSSDDEDEEMEDDDDEDGSEV